jgi:hypothetical protein
MATKQAAAADQLEILSSTPDDAFPFGLRVTVHLPQLPRAEREHLYADAACGCRSVSRKYSAGRFAYALERQSLTLIIADRGCRTRSAVMVGTRIVAIVYGGRS